MGIKQILHFVQKMRPQKINPAEMDKIYEEASVFVEKIPKEKFTEAVANIFQTAKKEENIALYRLAELRKCADELDCTADIKDIIIRIEKETREFIREAERFSTKSKYDLFQKNSSFNKKFDFDFDKIEEYFRIKMEASHYDKKYYHAWNIAGSCKYTEPIEEFKIGELPKGILPENGIVYHGTTKGRTVAKEGLSPLRSRQLDKHPREFGAAIYTTPDKDIASYFARITGRIIPMKVDVQKTAFVESVGFGTLTSKSLELAKSAGIDITEQSKLNNSIIELIVNRLFREAGYDSVYTANGMNSGWFTNSIDKYIGKAQSQLVVFDPKKVSLGKKKTLSQKLNDELLQIKAQARSFASTIKTAYEDPIGTLFSML